MTFHTLGLTPALDVVYQVPHVVVGSIHRPRTIHRTAGGKSLNVARALARLGRRTRAIVPLGGPIGDLVEALLRETTVDVDRIESAVGTRLCITAADDSTKTLTEFYESVESFDVPLTSIAERLTTIAAGEWLTISGAIPPVVDASELARILAALRERGVLIAVDVHGPALPTLLEIARPQVVKVNRHEAHELTEAHSAAESAELLVHAGATTAIVTDGSAGSTARSSTGEAASMPPARDPGAYPVGSGDCFLAGLVAALAQKKSLPDAMTLASAVATANARVPGAAIFDLPGAADGLC